MLSRLLIAVALASLAGGTSVAQQLSSCVEGNSEPSVLAPGVYPGAELRPTQTASCDYDTAELNRRVLSLLQVGSRAWSVSVAERIFGLPAIHTAIDDPWSARYTLIFAAAEGHGDWRMLLGFDEEFRPRGGANPPRFRGTHRPGRVDDRAKPEVSLTIDWLRPQYIAPGTEQCLKAEELIRRARQLGWRLHEETIIDVAGRPRTLLTRGTASIDMPPPEYRPCITELSFSVDAAAAELR